MFQNPGTGTSDRNRIMVHGFVIQCKAVTDPEPSARAAAGPRTVRLALELLGSIKIRGVNVADIDG